MELKARQLLHSTYKLFAASVYLQEMGIFLQGIAYVRYAIDGIGINSIRNLGELTWIKLTINNNKNFIIIFDIL